MADELTPIEHEIYARCRRIMPQNVYDSVAKFELKEDDILMSGGAKTGTTWMQQILHQLRSDGNMDFEDILDVVPFLEYVAMGLQSADGAKEFRPRIFKTHGEYGESSKNHKVIVITRNPADAALSLYHFYVNWLFMPEELSLDRFVNLFVLHDHEDHAMILNATAIRHLMSWYPHRKEERILWLHYEDLKADLGKCIKLIADFIGVGVKNEELLNRTEQQSTLEFMLKHRSKFILEKSFRAMNELVGRDKDALIDETNDGCRVRNGRVNESKEAFSPETLQKIDKKWIEMAKSTVGFDSYDEMRAAINKELGRKFPA